MPSGGPRDTPTWKLEAAPEMPVMQERPLRAAVHKIKLTATQEITPCIPRRNGEEAQAQSIIR
jgi:hypothetical protein